MPSISRQSVRRSHLCMSKTINSIRKQCIKKTTKVDIEDLLGDEITSEHDLLAEPAETITQNDATTRAKGSSTAKRHFNRSALLNKPFYFMKPRLGSSPSNRHPDIRLTTWLTIMQLVKDEENMMKVVDLIPMLHEGGSALPTFLRRSSFVVIYA